MPRNFSRGFTLLELLLVIVVIAILASIAYPVYIGMQERAKTIKDMNNLRQIGIATQLYMNDNDGVLPGSTTIAWMSQLHQTKYLSSWNIFQSPFDIRSPSETNATAPVSYGINGNNVAGTSVDKIASPTVFILFAPAQASTASVSFLGLGTSGAPGVWVYKSTSNPGGTATGGTHSSRRRINALFADLHVENMFWTTFINDQSTQADPTASQRWTPAPTPAPTP